MRYVPHRLFFCLPVCLQNIPARILSQRIVLFGALLSWRHFPEVIPLAVGHSFFKVLCLLTRTSLPKKEGCSRMSKTQEKHMKTAYFHALGNVL